MNKELKSRWVTALRSGDYKQVRGHLRTNNGYCCLGVLCEVAGIQSLKCDNHYVYNFGTPGESAAGLVGPLLTDLLNSDVQVRETQITLQSMNDGEFLDEGVTVGQKSFNEIADWLEENIKEDAS